MGRLKVELVPQTAWWSNVRSNVSRKDWETCKRYVRQRSSGKCEICGGVGYKGRIDCHEIWSYDDDAQLQMLVDLIALCPDCHQVKHLGHAEATGNLERALQHLADVNGWSSDHTMSYAKLCFEIWELRSQVQWDLDISMLSILGIQATVNDREKAL